MPRRAPWLWSIGVALLGCTASGEPEAGDPWAGLAAMAEPAPQMSVELRRPTTRVCDEAAVRREAGEVATPGYHFELDGAVIHPAITLLADGPPREGELIHLQGATMVLGPPGHYRYFSDPDHPGDLELTMDGGPRHLVALRVTGAIARPGAALRNLRGLSLKAWSPEIAATVARLDGTQLYLDYDAHTRRDPKLERIVPASRLRDRHELPALVTTELPANLRYLSITTDEGSNLLFDETPPDPRTFAGLARFKQLRYLRLDADSSPSTPVDAGTLAALSTLERLDLEGFTELHHPERLGALVNLRALGLNSFSIDDIGFVASLRELRALELPYNKITDIGAIARLPQLRSLDLRNTRVTSLAPLAGHPTLERIHADATPITALPATPPPHLSELSLMLTRLTHAEVEQFAALAPAARIRHDWDQALADVASCATRLNVRTGGTCHRHAEYERTLFQIEDTNEVRDLLPLLRIDEAASGGYCMCCGGLTLEFYREQTLLAALGMHHGKALRWSGWPGDGALADRTSLCAWLTRHGVRDACDDLEP